MSKKWYNWVVGILIAGLSIFIIFSVIFEGPRVPDPVPGEKEIQDFKRCVNNSELVLYGRTNSQVFMAQKEELGEFMGLIPFVDCLNHMAECEGILFFPAWRLYDQIYYGSFSKDVLIKLMGCE